MSVRGTPRDFITDLPADKKGSRVRTLLSKHVAASEQTNATCGEIVYYLPALMVTVFCALAVSPPPSVTVKVIVLE